jgi:ABC-2 type transport system ATP-binding protein
MAPNKAIVLSTHILEEVEAVCTRAIIIDRGRIMFDGTPQELLSRGPLDEVFRNITTKTAAQAS